MRQWNLFSLFFIACIFVCVPVLVFFPLLTHLSTALLDWNDYPYIVWTVIGNVDKLRSLSLPSFFDTNAFSSFSNTLLFSDILLPQSIIALFFSLFFRGPVLIFNLTFFAILTLNSIAAYMFWGRFTRSLSRLVLVLCTAYSPYFFLQVDHFQMINFWPFFLGLYFLLVKKLRVRDVVLAGLLAGVLFSASVYLWVFYITAAGMYFCVLLWQSSKRFQVLRLLVLFLMCSLMTTAPLALKYLGLKAQYGATREYGEYVSFAAHASDYLFTTHLHSTLNTLPPIQKWNAYNRHGGESATFPGFVLTTLALTALFTVSRGRDRIEISMKLERREVFFLGLLLCGLIFSLGPRLNVNGSFVDIPLPYHLILKTIPLVEPVRATARWSFLFYLGLTFFAGKTLMTIEGMKRGKIFLCLIAVLYIVDVVPIHKRAEVKAYYPDTYLPIESACHKQPQILLEYPLTQQHSEVNLISNLSYRTTMLLASSHHKCLLVNGYSGYAPRGYNDYEQALTTAVRERDSTGFFTLLQDRKVELLRVHYEYLATADREVLRDILAADPDWKMVAGDSAVGFYSKL